PAGGTPVCVEVDEDGDAGLGDHALEVLIGDPDGSVQQDRLAAIPTLRPIGDPAEVYAIQRSAERAGHHGRLTGHGAIHPFFLLDTVDGSGRAGVRGSCRRPGPAQGWPVPRGISVPGASVSVGESPGAPAGDSLLAPTRRLFLR